MKAMIAVIGYSLAARLWCVNMQQMISSVRESKPHGDEAASGRIEGDQQLKANKPRAPKHDASRSAEAQEILEHQRKAATAGSTDAEYTWKAGLTKCAEKAGINQTAPKN